MNKKLKKAVIREEFVALTGDYIKAIILNQFLYWTDRINDIDKFITEERKRIEQEGLSVNIDPQNGWIYKTAEELLDETMLGMAQTTIRVHIKKLLETGYLLERNNPKFKWDKTKQYRVDLLKIQTDLLKLGYTLQGYKLPLIVAPNSETKLPSSDSELREYENRGAVPDITLKTKPNNIKTIAAVKTPSPHKQVIEHYHNKFLSIFGEKPLIDGGKDGNIIKKLLQNCSADRLIELLDKFFELDDPFIRESGYTIGVFKTQINKLKTVGVNRNQTNTQQPNRSDLKQLASNDDPEYLEFLRIEREKESQRKLGVTGY